MINTTLKEAYKVIDDVMQEVNLAEESSLEAICSKLQQENVKFKSPVIDSIISILKQWGKVPANEIKAEVDRLLEK